MGFGRHASLFIIYAKILWPYWLAAMGAIGVIWGEHAERFLPKTKEQINKLIPPGVRRRFEIGIMVLVLLFAGFEAWEDQYEVAERSVSTLQGANYWLGIWKARADERRQQVASDSAQIRTLQDKLTTAENRQPQVIYKEIPAPMSTDAKDISDIAALMREGQAIADIFEQKDDSALIAKQYPVWVNKVNERLATIKDPTFAAQFATAQGTGQVLSGHYTDGNAYWGRINGKTTALGSILQEMRR